MNFPKNLTKLRGDSSRAVFAKTLGISENTLRNYEKGLSLPNFDVAMRICRQFDVRPEWLLYGEGPVCHDRLEVLAESGIGALPSVRDGEEAELVMVPMVQARLAAGMGSFESGGEVSRHYAFRYDFLSRKGTPAQMVLMRVAGDSMEPEVKNDDVVLIDQSQTQPMPGQIFAVGVEDLVYLKMVDSLPGKIVLKSFNPAYPPIEVDVRGDLSNGVNIIGQVIWIGREL